MKIQELKKLVLTSKKENLELSKAYAAILKQVESATIGVKNPETDEIKLIVNASKKELKEQEQSKSMNAPYSQTVIDTCNKLIKELSPEVISEEQTTLDILNNIAVISEYSTPDMKTLMQFAKQSGKNYDMKLYNSIVKEILSKEERK